MGLLNRLRGTSTEPGIDDTHLYAHIAKEIDSGFRREGVWAKALTECNFDEAKARAIYMRMAVKVLQKEIRDTASQEAARQQQAMQEAIHIYRKGQYAAALEGLLLRMKHKKDPLAMACLANIALHGLANGKIDIQAASQLMLAVEQSTDPHARYYLGVVLEHIDWRRALANYDFAASKNHESARTRSQMLRNRLKNEGKLPKGFFQKIIDY